MTKTRLPLFEFIVLVSIMFSMIAFGTDAMLPALPEIANDLGLSDVNRAQLVLTVFVLGTGIGQLFTGPVSDTLGRKPVITGGLLLFIFGSLLSYYTTTMEGMLLARFLQGLGVSAPRSVTMAMVRDLYAGRMMARVMSFSMVLFVLVPAIAPLAGQALTQAFGWRSIYLSFVLFALIGILWLNLRQPETHAPGLRRAMKWTTYSSAMREVITSRQVMTYMLVLSFGYGALFGYLSSAQQVFVDVFGVGDRFPKYFAIIALISGLSGFVNGMLVMRLGMRLLAQAAFGVSLLTNLAMLVLFEFSGLSPQALFAPFLVWSTLSFILPGLTFGNLNALAMEPMGHIAGMAAAVIGALATLIGVLIAIPIGLAFNGSIIPLLIGFSICSALSFGLMLTNPKGDQTPD